MSTIRHNQTRPPCYKVTHFTPQVKSCWRWIITIPVITLSGLQPTITGDTVNVGSGTTMWSGLPGAPSFTNRAEAIRWAVLMDLPNVIVE